MNVSRSLIPRIANRVGLCVLALAASMATPLVIADDDGVRKAEQARMDHVELQEALGILAGGDAAARRKVAEDACYRFKALDSFPYDETMLNQIMEDLRRYLRHEEEDWISMLLVQRIDCHDSHFLQPLFLDALAGPSPNLHWRVYQWLR